MDKKKVYSLDTMATAIFVKLLFTKLLQLYCIIHLYTFLNGLSLSFNHILSSNLSHQYLLCEFKSGIYDGDFIIIFVCDFYNKFNFTVFFLSPCLS